ncbi:MAG: DUF4234 domain-containing protein [Mycobacteriales bacterium]
MTEPVDPPQQPVGQEPPAPAPAAPAAPAGYGTAPAAYGTGPVGKVRGTGVCILLAIVTLGVYSWYWFFSTHEAMKRHKGSGLGGGLALVLAIFVGIVMPYLTSSEVGELYERSGRPKRVSGLTGLWYFPGMFILVGPIVWFVKTNGALNDYWKSVGATG